jgi:hypothetical protein
MLHLSAALPSAATAVLAE